MVNPEWQNFCPIVKKSKGGLHKNSWLVLMFQIYRRKYQSYFLTHRKIEDDCHMAIAIHLCFRWASLYPRCNTSFRAVAASFPISLTMRTTITWSHLPSTNQPVKEVRLKKRGGKHLKKVEVCLMIMLCATGKRTTTHGGQ